MSMDDNSVLVEELYAAAEAAHKAGDTELEKELERMAGLREDPCYRAAVTVRDEVKHIDAFLYNSGHGLSGEELGWSRDRKLTEHCRRLASRLTKLAQDLEKSVRVG